MGAAVLEYLGALQTSVQLVRDALAMAREWKAARGGAPEGLEQKLEQAEQQLKLAEVTAAQELGYRICKRHWPPGIMVEDPVDEPGGGCTVVWTCSNCGSEERQFFSS